MGITQQTLRRMDPPTRRLVSHHKMAPAEIRLALGVDGKASVKELCMRRDAYQLASCSQTRSHNIHSDSMDRVNKVLDRESAYKMIDGLDGIILKGIDEWRESSEETAISTLYDLLESRRLELEDAKAIADLQSEFAETPSDAERSSFEVTMTGRAMWPRSSQMYRVVVAAVLVEVRTSRFSLSERRRAELLGRSHGSYQRNWSKPYLWLEELVRRSYLTAKVQLNNLILDNA